MRRKCCREGDPPEPEFDVVYRSRDDQIIGMTYIVWDLLSEAKPEWQEVGEIKYVASFGPTFVSPEVLNEP